MKKENRVVGIDHLAIRVSNFEKSTINVAGRRTILDREGLINSSNGTYVAPNNKQIASRLLRRFRLLCPRIQERMKFAQNARNYHPI